MKLWRFVYQLCLTWANRYELKRYGPGIEKRDCAG